MRRWHWCFAVTRKEKQVRSYAYISTGNFNEKTATVYADSGLFTSNEVIVNDLHTLFRVLRKEVAEPKFKRLLVARFNLLPELRRRIGYEINMAKAGKRGTYHFENECTARPGYD